MDTSIIHNAMIHVYIDSATGRVCLELSHNDGLIMLHALRCLVQRSAMTCRGPDPQKRISPTPNRL